MNEHSDTLEVKTASEAIAPVSPISPFSVDEIALCTRVLEAIIQDPLVLSPITREARGRLFAAAGRAAHPTRTEVNRRIKALRREKRKGELRLDRAVRANTEIRTARLESVFVPPAALLDFDGQSSVDDSPSAGELQNPRACYVCKDEFKKLHFFYDSMCPKCAHFNYAKRFQTARLDGRVALITGARLKIGYQAALMMLRAGARVIVSTRFPQDAAMRYAREPDFKDWGARLKVHGLDLRHSPSVELFTRYLLATEERLDILINNAAQTVRRPPGFYAHLLEIENRRLEELPEAVRPILADHYACRHALGAEIGAQTNQPLAAGDSAWLSEWHLGAKNQSALGLTASAELSQIPYRCDEISALGPSELFPVGRLDADLQQVDLRKVNSWRMKLADVPTAEMLEVQLVNSVAPFILCSKLKPLMLKHPTGQKHVVNVSAMEGKFARHTKTDKHPHTNMAKAALNMLTLTSARDYAEHGIFMNAVDTGWVTDEDPAQISARKQEEHDFQPPLDIVDGAARVCDPFFAGLLTGQHSWGNFLKDYFPTEW